MSANLIEDALKGVDPSDEQLVQAALNDYAVSPNTYHSQWRVHRFFRVKLR